MASSSSSGLKTLELNDQKAGMEGLEKQKINSIIYNASKGTRYFLHQQKRQEHIDQEIRKLMYTLDHLTEAQKKKARHEMDELAARLDAKRDLSHTIVHIDMDAFYAAVEMRDNPEYKDKPMAVGSMSMLSTSNYIARRYGVRAAMPGFIGKKLCPSLIIVPPNFTKYTQVSAEIRDILSEYDPHFLPMSLDEAYLDITPYLKEKGNSMHLDLNDVDVVSKLADDIVQEIRQKIYEKTQLTASAGIAPNMMLAKICSDINKPNGQFKIQPNVSVIKDFIKSLPVRKISGIGPTQDQLLKAVGLATCHDLWEKRELLPLLFTSTSAHFYLRASLGIGSTAVRYEGSRKSKGVEVTFQELNTTESLTQMCQDLCQELSMELQEEKILGKVVVLKIKTVEFEVKTKHRSLPQPTSKVEDIFQAAKALLMAEITAAHPEPLRLRLMGVRMTNLVSEDACSSAKQATITELFQQFSRKGDETILFHDNGDSLTDLDRDVLEMEDRIDKQAEFSVNEDDQKSLRPSANLSVNMLDVNDGERICEKDEHEDTELKAFNSSWLDNNEIPSSTDNQHSKTNGCDVADDNTVDGSSLSFVCPVCQLCVSSWNLDRFNQHLDLCLNKATVRELVKDTLTENTKKRKPELQSSVKGKSQKKTLLCYKIDNYFS